jgi:hypothetical protein
MYKDEFCGFNTGSSEGRVLQIRLRGTTEQALRAYSHRLGTSLHAAITMILEGFVTLSRTESEGVPAIAASRFLEAMESHELGPQHVVDVMSAFGFTLPALGNRRRLTALLSSEVLLHVAELFHLRVEWLLGRDERVVADTSWSVENFATAIEVAKQEGRAPSVTLVRPLCDGSAATADDWPRPVVAAVRREHVTSKGTAFVTLQVWPLDRCLTVEPPSKQIADLIDVCRRLVVPVAGIDLPRQIMHELALGTRLPVQTLGCLLPRRWDPTAPWSHRSSSPLPTAASTVESPESSGYEPAATIDLYGMLARQQRSREDKS